MKSKLTCPYCENDKIVVKVDFKSKSPNAVGICIKTAYKGLNFFGSPVIKGCGKTFDIDVKKRKSK